MNAAGEKRRRFECAICQDTGLVYPPKAAGLFARFVDGRLHRAHAPARPLPHPCICAAGDAEAKIQSDVDKLQRALGHKAHEIEIFRFRQAKG